MKYYFIQVYNHLSLALVIYLNIKSEINIALPFAICICQSLPLLVAISIKLSKQETIHKRTMAKAKAQTPSSVPHLVSGSSNLAPPKSHAKPSQTPKSFHCHWPGIVSRRLKTRQLHYSCGQNPPARSTKMTFQCAGSNETEPNPNPPRQFHMQMTKMNLINNCLSIHLTSLPHTFQPMRCIILMRFCWRQFFMDHRLRQIALG